MRIATHLMDPARSNIPRARLNVRQCNRQSARTQLGFILWVLLLPAWLVQETLAADQGNRPPTFTGTVNLVWHADRSQFDAEVTGAPLTEVLTNLARATGWSIFVEPGVQRTIDVRFLQVDVRESLRRLLGDLNFAIRSHTNLPPSLYVFDTAIASATQRVNGGASAAPGKATRTPIATELVATLKSGRDAAALARQLGARRYKRLEGTQSYLFEFANEKDALAARNLLEGGDDAESVDFNYSIAPPPAPELLASGIAPPTLLKARPLGDGHPVIVGLIDTAVQTRGVAYQDFLLKGISLFENPGAVPGELTHGTSMAETIVRGMAQIADTQQGSTVRILPVDVYGGQSTTSTFDVAQGIQAAIKGGANIINLSLGSDGDTPYLRELIATAHRQGVVIVGAAGNTPVTTPFYPAAYSEVIAATAGDRSGQVASYANRGEFVDVMAPGTGLVHYNHQAYLGSGTSYAAAYVSGIAAALGETGSKAAEIEAELIRRLGVQRASPKAP